MPLVPSGFIKRFLPRSLLGRSLLIIVTPLVLLQVVATFVFFDRHWDTVTRRLAGGVAGDIAMIIEVLGRTPEGEEDWVFRTARARMALDPTLERTDDAGEEQPWGHYPASLETLANAIEERIGRPFLIAVIEPERAVEIRIQTGSGVLTVVAPRKRLFSSTTDIFVMWMVGASLFLVAVATIFMRNQVKPIRRLAAAADDFGKGREVPTFKPEGAAEVRQAATAFNLMRERLRRYISQRTEMLAGVSHDLRTPLTRLRLQLAMLGDSPDVRELRRDVDEMERMIEGYLAFVRDEGEEAPVEFDLTGLLEEVAEAARRAGAAIDLHSEARLCALVRPEAMRRCLTNVLDNAARHAAHVTVRAGERGDSIEIVIDDDGPGVPPESREEVFKPFVRLDASRNPETGGSGLGLTIARDVVRSHGGDITLDDAPIGGLRVRIRLPV